jgi:RIO-like serine/threonine protein kinase
MLLTLRSLGFDVPRPLAWAERGRIWVHTWLIMEERPDAKTLAELAGTDESRARKLLPQISEVVGRLISHQIHHVDFHPGNVLVDPEDRICLIDFDKTARVTIPTSELAERYRRRWQRAVTKHALPSWLGDEFQIA